MYINSKELSKIKEAINVLKELSNQKENGLLFYKERIQECIEITINIENREIDYNAKKVINQLKREKPSRK